MDDGGRCLLDVIDDPQLLQSFLENTNGAIERLESGVNPNVENPSIKTLVKPIDSTNSAVKVAANITSMTSLVSDSKQMDQMTTFGGNSSPLIVNKQNSGQLVIDDKQMLNMVSSSVGLIPLSALSSSMSVSIAQPTLTTLTSTTPIGQMTSTVPMRGTAPTWPTSFQFTGQRNGGAMTVQLPQQLIVPAGMQMGTAPGLQQLLLTAPRQGGGGPQLTGGIQPGQLVQIIQTPSGPQILPTNPSAALQTIVSTNSATKPSSTSISSRSNKQILPKPPGSGVSTSNAITTNSANKGGQQMTAQNTLKVINSLPSNMTQIPTNGTTAPQTQQILIGPNGQPAGVVGPQGTILFNHMIPGMGSQPILIQQNIGNIPNSVQLTLRPQSHISNGLTAQNITTNDQNTGLINALTGQSAQNISRQTPSQSPQPQTFVIPNHSTSVTSASPGVVMTSAGRPTPNIIFSRPPSFGASHQSHQPTVPTGQQFLQLQTPNGPVLVALPTNTQLFSQPQASTQPTHGIQLGNTMFPIGAPQLTSNLNTNLQTSAHPALQALLTHTDNTNGQTVIQTSVPSVATSNTVIITSQPQIITRPQQSKPSVNLAELLKEHGILPESSPPSSPTNNSLTDINSGSVHSELIHTTPTSQQTVLMLPSGPNQPPNIVLTQNSVSPAAPPQLRLALGPDGSVILQPHITNAVQPQIQSQFISNSNNLKYNDNLKDSSGLGSSQPSPDSTTPSIDTATTSSSTSTTTTTTTTATTVTNNQNTSSALLEQLNTGPAVKVPDLVASLALSNGSSTPIPTSEESKQIASQTALIPLTVQNINKSLEQQKQTILTIPVQSGDSVVQNVSNGSSNAVIRIGSCDSIPTSLVLTTTPTTVFTSPPKAQMTDPLSANLSLNSSPNNSTNSVSVNGTATTVIDQNGVPMVQVSSNNQEFLQRLETQLKSLSALKSPTNQQKELLQEMLSLKQKMNEARHLNNTNEDQKVVLSTASSICVSPQTQQLLQSTTPTTQQQQNQSSVEVQTHQTAQNMHLVNLLKQTPVNQTSPQIRLMTPVSTTPVSGTTTFQVGNQIITFTTPAKQQLQNLKAISTNQTVMKPQTTAPTSAVIFRLHGPTPTTTTTYVTTSTTTKTSIIKNDLHLDKDRRNAKILKAIQQQLNVDQNAATKPDTKRPFSSRDDACKRLLRYHVHNSPTMTLQDMDKHDQLFERLSQHLLHKKQQLFDKFRVLLLKQSMKETPSSEHVMIDRMFINDETNSLKTDKESVAEGKVLSLPPPPPSWYQEFRSSLEEEEQKLFINRKRKSSIGSDDEFNSHSNQIRRHEEPVEESDESEDEDEDSDDEDIEEKVNSMSNFFSKEPNLGHFYDNLHNSLHVPNGSQIDGQSHVPLNSYVDPSQQHNDLELYSNMNGDNVSEDWTESILNNSSANRRIAWNHRFGIPESEAAVAVESILNADDDDEQDMSVDLSGIDGLDDNLEDDNEEDDDDEEEDDDEDDEEEDDVNGFSIGGDGHQHQQHVDQMQSQMQCAIKSILDMPSVASHPSHNNSYAFHSHSSHPSLHQHMNDFRNNMDYPHIHNIHDQRPNIIRSYGGQHPTGVNDPILDEAVKSILS